MESVEEEELLIDQLLDEKYETRMESVEEEELLIDQLLDALNGIERCFESENQDTVSVLEEEPRVDKLDNITQKMCPSKDKPSLKTEKVAIQPKETGAMKRTAEKSTKDTKTAMKKVCYRKSPVKMPKTGSFIESKLPVELMIKIFKYLPICDKKSAKLVCKRWNDISNKKLFAQTQRFVCCGIYDTKSITTTLMKTNCEYLNLEFYRVNFQNYPVQFWEICGPKIHALYFVDCLLNDLTVTHMITYCVELEHLSFMFEHCRSSGQPIWSNDLFTTLLKSKKTRPNLVSLELHLNQSKWFSNNILQNLFSLFPRISRITYSCHSLDPISCEPGICAESVAPHEIQFTDLWSQKMLTFSSILNKILTPPDTIEKLKLDLHTNIRRTGFAWNSIMTYANLQRLREINMEIDLKMVEGTTVIEFCTLQKQLKTLSCRILGSAKLFISLFLSQLLDNCPALRNLDVTYNNAIFVSYELFKKMVSSNLQSFSIQCKEIVLAPRISQQEDWPINSSLRTLHTSYGVGEKFQLLLIRTFRNLRHLELHELTDALLQAVWKHQTELISLKLSDIENCTAFGFSGLAEFTTTAYSIRRLRKLEYLILEAVNTEWNVTSEVFTAFVLPNLKYLCVDIEGKLVLQLALLEQIRTFSKLVAASVRCSGVPRNNWLNLIAKWKHLRYLRIVDQESTNFSKKQYVSYFKRCPQLRAFVHEHGNVINSYFYNIFEKKVEKKTGTTKYRISSEKVDKAFIDWVWF